MALAARSNCHSRYRDDGSIVGHCIALYRIASHRMYGLYPHLTRLLRWHFQHTPMANFSCEVLLRRQAIHYTTCSTSILTTSVSLHFLIFRLLPFHWLSRRPNTRQIFKLHPHSWSFKVRRAPKRKKLITAYGLLTTPLGFLGRTTFVSLSVLSAIRCPLWLVACTLTRGSASGG
jgi:hypothetical protein